jgi:hypothetical protein
MPELIANEAVRMKRCCRARSNGGRRAEALP